MKRTTDLGSWQSAITLTIGVLLIVVAVSVGITGAVATPHDSPEVQTVEQTQDSLQSDSVVYDTQTNETETNETETNETENETEDEPTVAGAPADWEGPTDSVLATTQPLTDHPQYTSGVFTVADLVAFGYVNDTEIQMPGGNYTINRSEAVAEQVNRGTYTIAGDRPFSALRGDPISNSVVGFYAMDEDGFGLSTELHTYISSNSHDGEQFVVFAYQNNTNVTVENSNTGDVVMEGTIDAGEHLTLRDSELPYSTYVSVYSNKSVSAHTYFDQGYYVPAKNGQFSGEQFYTFVGSVSGWTHDMVVSSYADDNNVTIRNQTSGDIIWTGTLDEGEAHAQPFNEDTYVEVESEDTVTVGVMPWESWGDNANYHHSTSVPSKSGSPIGTDFIVPTLNPGYTYLFGYKNDTQVTVVNATSEQVVQTVTLDAGESLDVNPGAGLWRVFSNKGISVQKGYGEFGADFAPINFGQSEGASFSGTVTGVTGDPVEDATVRVYNARNRGEVLRQLFSPNGLPEPITATTTQADGTYQTAVFDPGRHFVVVTHDQWPTGLSESVHVSQGETETVNVELSSPLQPISAKMDLLGHESRSLIDRNTRTAAELYIDGYETFVDPTFSERLLPTEMSDGLTAISLALSYKNPEEALLEEATKTALEEVGWTVAEHGTHESLARQFATIDSQQRTQLNDSAASLTDEEWLTSFEYTDSVQQAIQQGYTETAVYNDAMDEIAQEESTYADFAESTTPNDIPSEFSFSETQSVLQTQINSLRGNGPAEGVIITPKGNVYLVKQGVAHKQDYELAKGQAKAADAGQTVMDGVQVVGQAATVFGGPQGAAAGTVAQGVGTVGSYAFGTFKLYAEHRMGKQWNNGQLYWADDVATIPTVYEESREWLESELEDPRLGEADAEITEMDINAIDTGFNKKIVIANQPDYPWYVPPNWRVQWKATNTANITVKNTGALPDAKTRLIVTDRYGDEAVSELPTVAPGPQQDPMELASGEQRELSVPYSADFRPLDPFNWHHLTATVWTEGKQPDSETAIYYVTPSLDLTASSTSTAYVRSEEFAYTSADTESDVSVTAAEFQDQLGNVTKLAETTISPSAPNITANYTTNASTKDITFLMVTEASESVNLHVYDESGRHVGFNPLVGDDEVLIPDTTYSGSNGSIEQVQINNVTQQTIDLRVDATEFETNSPQSVELWAVPVPERSAFMAVSPAAVEQYLSVNASASTTVSLAEVGGQKDITGVSVSSTNFENAQGTQLPDGVEVTASVNDSQIGNGESTNLTVTATTESSVSHPDPETRYSGNVTVQTGNAGTVNVSVSTLLLDTPHDNVTLSSAEGTVDGAGVQKDTDADELYEIRDGKNVSSVYDTTVTGSGNASITFTGIPQAPYQTVYAIDGGSWSQLNVTGSGATMTATINQSIERLAFACINVDGGCASDTTDDRRLNDVNGDGEFNIFDVQVLFDNQEDPVVLNHTDAFDFEEDGTIDVFDVQKLFERLQAVQSNTETPQNRARVL